ncbi:MAG: thiol:disulfide interchange protein, partial [Planctomycetota bacterium]
RHDDEDDVDAWTWIHKSKAMVYAVGTIAEGTDVSGIEANLTGLTCTDAGVCVPYNEIVQSLGEGTERYFKDFPADLVAGGSVAAADTTHAVIDEIAIGSDSKAAGKLYQRTADGKVQLALVVQIAEGFHLYHGPDEESLAPMVDGKRSEIPVAEPTRIALPDGFDWDVRFPEPDIYEEGLGKESFEDVPVLVHHGQVVFLAQADIDGKDTSALQATLIGQACDDSGCFDVRFDAKADGEGPAALTASFATLAQAAAGGSDAPDAGGADAESDSEGSIGGAGDPEQESLGSFLLLAVFWGLITLLMPCTYPMIPITISFFTKQAMARDGKVLPLSIMYGVGIVLIFILIGVVVGPVIIKFATHPVTNLIIGSMFIFFSLVLFGAVNIQPPAFLMNAAGKASSTGGVLGVFLMGMTLVVTSFTCTAPFLGSLLSFGAAGGGDGAMLRIVLGMGVFGLTMATPFVLLSLVPGKMQKMPQAGEWMHVLKVFLGFVELAAALKFISNADVVWGWGILSREIFLMLWFGIFLCASFFLFGWIKLEGEDGEHIGPMRMVSAVVTLLFGLYSGMGVMGYQLDDTLTAIIPPYSSERLFSNGGGNAGPQEHSIVKDDYDAALALAFDSNKLLLVNFTGHT